MFDNRLLRDRAREVRCLFATNKSLLAVAPVDVHVCRVLFSLRGTVYARLLFAWRERCCHLSSVVAYRYVVSQVNCIIILCLCAGGVVRR